MTDRQLRIHTLERRARDLQRRIDELTLRDTAAAQRQLALWADFSTVFNQAFGDIGQAEQVVTINLLDYTTGPIRTSPPTQQVSPASGFTVELTGGPGTVLPQITNGAGQVVFTPPVGIYGVRVTRLGYPTMTMTTALDVTLGSTQSFTWAVIPSWTDCDGLPVGTTLTAHFVNISGTENDYPITWNPGTAQWTGFDGFNTITFSPTVTYDALSHVRPFNYSVSGVVWLSPESCSPKTWGTASSSAGAAPWVTDP